MIIYQCLLKDLKNTVTAAFQTALQNVENMDVRETLTRDLEDFEKSVNRELDDLEDTIKADIFIEMLDELTEEEVEAGNTYVVFNSYNHLPPVRATLVDTEEYSEQHDAEIESQRADIEKRLSPIAVMLLSLKIDFVEDELFLAVEVNPETKIELERMVRANPMLLNHVNTNTAQRVSDSAKKYDNPSQPLTNG